MIKVGLTGGIGSGKSMVCQVFSRLGVPVYHSDSFAKYLTETDGDIRDSLIRIMGDEVFIGTALNLPLMSALIFTNRSLLDKVNQIIHPRVAVHFTEWCRQHVNQAYVIQESAILFESRAFLMFDKYITVSAPEELRIKRVLSRKDMTVEKARLILENQLQESERVIRAHHVIINDDVTPVLPQVLQLHQTFSDNK
jgi:dephospho-CoA kinase